MSKKKMTHRGRMKPVRARQLHEFGHVVQGGKPGAFGNTFDNAWDWKRNSDMFRHKPKMRTVTENQSFDDYMKIQQVDNNARTNLGRKESEDALRSALAAGSDQTFVPDYGPRHVGQCSEAGTRKVQSAPAHVGRLGDSK
mgnify:FL=1